MNLLTGPTRYRARGRVDSTAVTITFATSSALLVPRADRWSYDAALRSATPLRNAA
jgi:hypothetical protein